jgi:hypothetical protein
MLPVLIIVYPVRNLQVILETLEGKRVVEIICKFSIWSGQRGVM